MDCIKCFQVRQLVSKLITLPFELLSPQRIWFFLVNIKENCSFFKQKGL